MFALRYGALPCPFLFLFLLALFLSVLGQEEKEKLTQGSLLLDISLASGQKIQTNTYVRYGTVVTAMTNTLAEKHGRDLSDVLLERVLSSHSDVQHDGRDNESTFVEHRVGCPTHNTLAG